MVAGKRMQMINDELKMIEHNVILAAVTGDRYVKISIVMPEVKQELLDKGYTIDHLYLNW